MTESAGPAANVLIEALSRHCRSNILGEKWLLSPSLRTGHQWLERVVRCGRPVANVHVKTIRSLAVDLSMPVLSDRGLTILSSSGVLLAALRALNNYQTLPGGYLDGMHGGTGLQRSVLSTINALRLAGIDPDSLEAGSFEAAGKGSDLASILREYEGFLEDEGFVDYAAVLTAAGERLRSDHRCLGEGTVVLLPDDLEMTSLEKEMMDSIPDGSLLPLPVDRAGEEHGDLQKMRIFTTVGESNEIRSVLRICLSRGIPLDDVELLYTDRKTYVPLVHDIFMGLGLEVGGLQDELPVTFAEGIPCTFSLPGKALSSWMIWRGRDYPQALLVRMIGEGLLQAGELEGTPGPSFGQIASRLRGLGIGFGRSRYEPAITEAAKGRTLQREGRDFSAAEKSLASLASLVTRLLDCTPEGEVPAARQLAAATDFLTRCIRTGDRYDAFAMLLLREEIEEMRGWLTEETVIDSFDPAQWLEELPRETRVLGSGPRPGKIHVDHLLRGGHSGRGHTFIIGLDDGRFPGSSLQDPILLDGERRSISSLLPRLGERSGEVKAGFFRLLARLRGEVTLGYSSLSLSEDRELFPSTVIRNLWPSPEGDGSPEGALSSRGEEGLSFAPPGEEFSLSLTEWWLWRLTGPVSCPGARSVLTETHPHLGRGWFAEAARRASSFSAWDGLVAGAGIDLDPLREGGPVVSARSLETAGACPRRFFFRYALNIEQPEELRLDPRRWLDPVARGALLHDLFERFLSSLCRDGSTPVFDRDHEALQSLLDELTTDYRSRYPPPSEIIFRRECEELSGTASTFLMEEERLCLETQSRPLYLEASLGLASRSGGTSIDTTEPIPIPLPGGGRIMARGKIDRIDSTGGSAQSLSCGIWDYKTGSSRSYRKSDPHGSGRRIQPWLYTTLVEKRLQEILGEESRVEYFGYFFPQVRAAGERIRWTARQLDEGGALVRQLCLGISAGAFTATDEVDEDCTYCDYRGICGSGARLGELRKSVLLKVGDSANEALAPFRTLRGREAG